MRSLSFGLVVVAALVGWAWPEALLAQSLSKPERPENCRIVPLGWNAKGEFAYLRDLDGHLCPLIPGFKSNWEHCLPEGVWDNKSLQKAWSTLGWEKEFYRNGFVLAPRLRCGMKLDYRKTKIEFALRRTDEFSDTVAVFAMAGGKKTQPLGAVNSDLEWVDAVVWSDEGDRVLVFWGNQFGTWEYVELNKAKLKSLTP